MFTQTFNYAHIKENIKAPVNSPHKWPVTRKMFPFDDVIMIFVIGQCGLTQQDQTYIRAHFKYHAKTQFRHIRSFWCMNFLGFLVQLLWQSKLQNHGELLYRIIHLFYIFSRPFDLAKGDSVILKRYTGGKMEHGAYYLSIPKLQRCNRWRLGTDWSN